jgi:general secretion pathway protein D
MKKAILTTTALVLILSGCAGDQAYREGERLMQEGKTVEGLKQLEAAVRENPNNVQYRTAYIQSRDAHIQGLITKGDEAMKAGRYDEAEARYREVLAMHPQNPRAQSALVAIDVKRRNLVLVREAREAFDKNEHDKARAKLRAVLAREPGQQEASALLKQIEDKTGKAKGAEFPKLAEAFRRPVTLEFRDASIKTLFDALSRQSGINFIFDKDVKTDTKLTIFARDTPIADALDMLLRTGQLARKVLNEKTLLVYPATPAKLKEYQELVVKGFFLSNAEAKQVVNMVRTMVKTRDIYIDEKLNLIMVRDTPEAIRLVEKLINLADRPEPEVMLEIEIMEVKRARLQELGVQWPTNFRVLLPESETTVKIVDGVVVTETVPGGRLTIEALRNLTSSDIGVFPPPAVNVRKDTSDVNILANPRIRVKNKEKAKIHVGDKVPVITSNVTSTGVTSESVSYLDVGLKVDVEPQVHMDTDVGIKVGLEVSNIVQQVKTDTGTLVYQLGSRNASTFLRLKDGETQVLAGLISDEDRTGANKVPGFGDLPLLGRLFSNQRDELMKTEIVMLLTPRIIRSIERPELAEGEFFAGTESFASDQPMQLRPAMATPALPAPARPEEPEPAPAPDLTSATEPAAEPPPPALPAPVPAQ